MTAPDSFPLELIAEIEVGHSGAVAFGDTDHDGLNEVIISAGPGCGNYRILEEQGNNVYTVEYTGACLLPFATGDLDQDGKAEIIGQVGSNAACHGTAVLWRSRQLSAGVTSE